MFEFIIRSVNNLKTVISIHLLNGYCRYYAYDRVYFMIVIFFCSFRLRLELRGHASATFSLGRVGDINQVDLNNLKKPISTQKLDINKVNLYFKVFEPQRTFSYFWQPSWSISSVIYTLYTLFAWLWGRCGRHNSPLVNSVIDFVFRRSDGSHVSVDTVHPSLLWSSSFSSPR